MDDCVPRTVVIYEHYRQIRLIRHSFAYIQGMVLKQPQSNVEGSSFLEYDNGTYERMGLQGTAEEEG